MEHVRDDSEYCSHPNCFRPPEIGSEVCSDHVGPGVRDLLISTANERDDALTHVAALEAQITVEQLGRLNDAHTAGALEPAIVNLKQIAEERAVSIGRSIDRILGLQARVDALESKLKSARPHVHRQQTAGTHEQDRVDAKKWIENDCAGQRGEGES